MSVQDAAKLAKVKVVKMLKVVELVKERDELFK